MIHPRPLTDEERVRWRVQTRFLLVCGIEPTIAASLAGQAAPPRADGRPYDGPPDGWEYTRAMLRLLRERATLAASHPPDTGPLWSHACAARCVRALHATETDPRVIEGALELWRALERGSLPAHAHARVEHLAQACVARGILEPADLVEPCVRTIPRAERCLLAVAVCARDVGARGCAERSGAGSLLRSRMRSARTLWEVRWPLTERNALDALADACDARMPAPPASRLPPREATAPEPEGIACISLAWERLPDVGGFDPPLDLSVPSRPIHIARTRPMRAGAEQILTARRMRPHRARLLSDSR